jgi:Uma2 family endonuclease
MSFAPVNRRYPPDEYLALERQAEFKSEYYDGDIYPMGRVSLAHIVITGNLACALNTRVRDRECEVYASKMRVLISKTGLYTYPDIVAVSRDPRFQDGEFDTLLNPSLIVEVLSPLTESYDRTKKFDHYRSLDSLREYVLVSQDEVRVECFSRLGNAWSITALSRFEGTLRLSSIACEVPLGEIYAKTHFPEELPFRGAPGRDNSVEITNDTARRTRRRMQK